MDNLIKIIFILFLIFLLNKCLCNNKEKIDNNSKKMIINYDNIRRLINQYLENHLELKKLNNDYKTFLDKEKLLEKKENELLKIKNVLTADVFNEKQYNFKLKVKEYQREKDLRKNIINVKRNEIKNEGKEIIGKSIIEFMKKNKIDLIFEPMFYSKNDENEKLTEKLFDILKKKFKIKEEFGEKKDIINILMNESNSIDINFIIDKYMDYNAITSIILGKIIQINSQKDFDKFKQLVVKPYFNNIKNNFKGVKGKIKSRNLNLKGKRFFNIILKIETNNGILNINFLINKKNKLIIDIQIEGVNLLKLLKNEVYYEFKNANKDFKKFLKKIKKKF